MPGGWIYVNRGLIERADNLSQLAGVLAHEIGHVTRRHSVQQMQQAQGANAGVSLLCTLTKVCEQRRRARRRSTSEGSALFAKFSRSDESEADAEAVGHHDQGRDRPQRHPGDVPHPAQRSSSGTRARLEAFFLTHPLAADRVTATEALIAAYPASALRALTKETTAFQAFRRRLLALPPSPVVKTP